MQKLPKLKFVICVCLLMLFSGPVFVHGFEDAIVAIVNDEIITLKDLKDYIHSTYVSLVAQGMNNDDLEKVMGELDRKIFKTLREIVIMLFSENCCGY